MKLIDVLNHHLNGGTFEYLSYDHSKAKEHFLNTDEGKKYLEPIWTHNEMRRVDKWDIPQEIRDQYSYWRKGKLRKVEFTPTGKIYRLYIGAKYAIPFYECRLEGLKLANHER